MVGIGVGVGVLDELCGLDGGDFGVGYFDVGKLYWVGCFVFDHVIVEFVVWVE